MRKKPYVKLWNQSNAEAANRRLNKRFRKNTPPAFLPALHSKFDGIAEVHMRIRQFTPILGIALVITGCDPWLPQAKSPDPPAPATAAAGMPIGPMSPRYQIVFSPHARADTFLIDTEKGRVWQMTRHVYLPDKPSAFSEIDIIDNKGEIGMKYSEFLRLNKAEGPSEQKEKSSSPSSTLEGGQGTASEPTPAGKR